MATGDINTVRNTAVGLPKGARLLKSGKYIYAFFSTYRWDSTKKRGMDEREYIGKVVDGKFVPNKWYREKLGAAETATKTETPRYESPALDQCYGPTALLMAVAKEIGIWRDLTDVYGNDIATTIVCLACYQILRQSSALYRFPYFARTHAMAKDLPRDLNSGRLSELTFAIGGDSTKRNELFKKRCARLEENEYLPFDSTKIASQSCLSTDTRKQAFTGVRTKSWT